MQIWGGGGNHPTFKTLQASGRTRGVREAGSALCALLPTSQGRLSTAEYSEAGRGRLWSSPLPLSLRLVGPSPFRLLPATLALVLKPPWLQTGPGAPYLAASPAGVFASPNPNAAGARLPASSREMGKGSLGAAGSPKHKRPRPARRHLGGAFAGSELAQGLPGAREWEGGGAKAWRWTGGGGEIRKELSHWN